MASLTDRSIDLVDELTAGRLIATECTSLGTLVLSLLWRGRARANIFFSCR
jgi:hypothetical protein